MNLKWETDKIISEEENSVYAYIENICEYKSIEYYYEARLVKRMFPPKLINLCREFCICINEFSPILADEIESQIRQYRLKLENNNLPIFRLEIHKDYITFFVKYPTEKGFLDTYPE